MTRLNEIFISLVPVCCGIQFPAGTKYFSLLYSVQTGSETQSASDPMGTGGSLPRGKAA
jgi:hypothetical protein